MKRRPLRVLVADHAHATRTSLQRQVEAAGCRVATATSAEDVIIQCDIDPPDVLMVDVDLPDMDGFELCEHVRHETRDLDLTIILMVEPEDDMTRTYLGRMVDYAGADFFFAKPCDGHLLQMLLDDIAAHRDRSGAASRRGFPTRAVWPTAQGRAPTSVC